ncbi:hypothetical protein [Nocardia tengchongensis]|uniref:hypothetical protein n=1 Tax=Nocardia tengchongensis TaxID=2055889 RepID=UPI00367A788D
MAQITVQWRPGGYVDLLCKYHVFIDGSKVGHIGRGEMLTISVDHGSHQVQLKLDWGTSPTVTVDLATDETRQLYCEPGANTLTALYYAMFRRQQYIKLTPTYLRRSSAS